MSEFLDAVMMIVMLVVLGLGFAAGWLVGTARKNDQYYRISNKRNNY